MLLVLLLFAFGSFILFEEVERSDAGVRSALTSLCKYYRNFVPEGRRKKRSPSLVLSASALDSGIALNGVAR
jgi:hypothetical protein